MNTLSVLDAITSRSSKRKFLNKPVPKEIQEKILQTASMTPSGANMQPWIVYAVSNTKVLETIGNAIISHIDAGGEVDQFIQYYPLKWKNPYKLRRIKTGVGLYEQMQVDRKDKDKRKELWYDNYRWFGAQTVFFVCTDKSLIEGAQGALIDCGAYMQSLMLAAKALGIDSCPQGSTTEYGRIIAKTLDLPNNLALLYSVVLGYEDTSAIQNTYQPERVSLDEIVTFID
ncbi:nitroreductase [Sulfurimonas sp. MAG313]|nr:nitroreductase [Sulfurimonas sp. MAG313]MDF1882160.1 nitroreductase [Sulfurimonas sp. MAG313]